MPPVNQQVIADRLRISRTTVSRCFTNHPGINPRTRAEVFALAARLGYQYQEPRSVASSPRKRPPSMGVLICSNEEEFYRSHYESPGVEILPGISECAQLQDWKLGVHFVSPREDSLSSPSYHAIHALRRRLWDGVALIYPFPAAVIEELAMRLPCVSLVEQYGTVPLDCVDVDPYKGISLLMDRLIAAGHRRIGFVSRPYTVEALWSYRRFGAYVEKLARAALRYREDDVVYVDPCTEGQEEEGYDRVVRQMRDGVTAWVCAADHQAYDLISALHERGLEVPRDVSVTGFDGILRPRGAPLLTTMRIPYREIGFAGGRRLAERMQKRFDTPHHVLLECRLQAGETIGPVPALVRA